MSITIEPRLSKFFLLEDKEDVVPFIIRVVGVGSSESRSLYVVAIDSSWSMDGEKMFYAKSAVAEMLKLLNPEDYITVYSFCGTVRRVLEPERAGSVDKVSRAVAGIRLGGGTDLHKLFKQLSHDVPISVEMLKKSLGQDPVVKLVLITDGNPTLGPKDTEKILHAVEGFGKHISTSLVVGIGDDYNERLLASIASKTNGIFEHLSDPSRMLAIIEKMISRYRKLSAKGVRLFMRTSPGIGVYIYNRPAYGARGGIEIEVGDVYEGEKISIVGEFVVPPQRRGLVFLASIAARYETPSGEVVEVPHRTITMPCVHEVSPEDIDVDEKVFREANAVRMAMALARDIYGSVSADKLRSVIEEIMNSTISVDSRELYTRTIDLRAQLEREGLSPDAMRKIVAIISRLLSGKYS